VEFLQHQPGSVLGSSRGGFELDKIMAFLEQNKVIPGEKHICGGRQPLADIFLEALASGRLLLQMRFLFLLLQATRWRKIRVVGLVCKHGRLVGSAVRRTE
ncbi:unnamed protein product, partial [Phaeothamnion confervicola]